MMESGRLWLAIGAAFGLLGVAAGAFGAHALEGALTPDRLDTFETAARYQVYHALALAALAYAQERWDGALLRAAGWLFTVGVFLFCGSLYVLALAELSVMGAVAPLGGASLLAGWACLLLAALRR
jgi:uncharacterized membrane protein YgdD (TMEM256/DUF423 family)